MGSSVLRAGEADGLGRVMRVYTKGWLPRSFVFTGEVTEARLNRHLRVDVAGDFDGYAEFKVAPIGQILTVDLLWSVDCHHPFVGPLSRVLPYPFTWNHRWALRRSVKLLQAQMDTRRGVPASELGPAPTFPHNIRLLRPLFGGARWARMLRTLAFQNVRK